jgi:hypothetical protein
MNRRGRLAGTETNHGKVRAVERDDCRVADNRIRDHALPVRQRSGTLASPSSSVRGVRLSLSAGRTFRLPQRLWIIDGMGWRDKLKAGAEEVKTGAGEATARARETMHDAQVRRELQNAYTELGRTTYTLVDEGSLRDERLDNAVARIRELGSQLVDSQPPSQ